MKQVKHIIDVTEFAKNIFGDILDNASIIVFLDDKSAEFEKTMILNQLELMKKNDIMDKIENNKNKLVLTFSNGKKVSFWASEFGGINKEE